MEHYIKEISSNIDVLRLSKQEYDAMNGQYKDALVKRFVGKPVLLSDINDIKTIIMTDGYNRVEFKIEVDEEN